MDEFSLTEWLDSSPDPATAVETTAFPEKQSEKVLTTAEVRVLNYVEQCYWETGLCPTPERVAEELSIAPSSCRKAYANETLRAQLAVRGIDPESLVTVGAVIKETKALSAKQIVCANMMLNLVDKRSQREKLAQIQVSAQQFAAWMRQPQFVEFMRKRSEALFSSSDWLAYRSLINNVASGDNKSLELFLRVRGIYRPEVNINLNIDAVLNQVVEVITRYVKDPLVLQAIAGELESIIDVQEVG